MSNVGKNEINSNEIQKIEIITCQNRIQPLPRQYIYRNTSRCLLYLNTAPESEKILRKYNFSTNLLLYSPVSTLKSQSSYCYITGNMLYVKELKKSGPLPYKGAG